MGNAWIVGILGVWTGLTAFFGFQPTGYAWNNWIVGIIAGAAALWMTVRKPTIGWTAAAFSAWLFISGFVSGLLVAPGYWWNELFVGVGLAILGFAGTKTEMRVTAPRTGTAKRREKETVGR